MSFTIHSIGDSAFLEQILIAVRLVTGNGNFKLMIGIGLLISGLSMCVRALFASCKCIDYHQVFLGWIVYQCLFFPTTTVTIQNAYTGEVSTVDKVPFGVAAAGGIVSTVGYGLTKIFDTSFGAIAPGITKSHFAESLSLLNDVRRQVHNYAVFEALDKAAGGNFDFRGSWYNYIRECTLTKIDINTNSSTQLMRQPIDQALRFDSKLYTTELKVSGLGQRSAPVNCTEAYRQLVERSKFTDPQVEEEVGKILGFNSANRPLTFGHITNALQAIGASRTAAANYVKNAILEPLYYEAASGRYRDWQDYNSAVMVNQAIQQRNTKWATEQTIFMTIVRPMLTFFEGFVYAITPLIAFMIVLGGSGIQLLGKYLQTIFWIQLWMPVMSIINLFIHVASLRALAHVTGLPAGLSSMYALDQAGDILQHWISAGGMLAAATPVISFFIVSGSTYAMSGIVGRISSVEGIDTSVVAPSAVQQSAVVTSGSEYAHNQHSGMIASGTESLLPSYNFGSTLSHGLSNVSSQLSQSSRSFTNALGRGMNEGVSQETSYARIADMGRSASAQNSDASRFVAEQGKSFSDEAGIGDDHKDYVQGLVAGGVTGSISLDAVKNKLMALGGDKSTGTALCTQDGMPSKHPRPTPATGSNISLSGKANTSSNAQDSTTSYARATARLLNSIRGGSDQSQSLTRQLSQSFGDQSRQGFRETWGESLSNSISSSASEVSSLSQTHSNMSKLQTQLGTATQSDLRSLAASVAKNDHASSYLNDHFQTNANSQVRSEANQLANHYRNFHGMDPTVSDTAGKMVALSNTANFSPASRIQALQGVTKAVQMSLGHHPDLDGGYGSIMPANKPTEPTTLEVETTQALGKGPSQKNAENIQAQAHTNVPTDGAAITGQAKENFGAQQVQQEQANRQFSASHIKKAESHLMHSTPDVSSSASGWGVWDNATDWLCRRKDQIGGALFAGSEENVRAFNNSIGQLATMTPEQRQQFVETINQGDESLAKSGEKFGGSLVFSAVKLGWSSLGAAASGYSAAKEWLTGNPGLSEAAKGISLEQRGAYYGAAFSAALDAGPKAATRFVQEHGHQFKATMAEVAQHRHGLTTAQSAVFAESFDTDRERMAEAVNGLKVEHAALHKPQEEIFFDANGKPILNQKDDKFTDHLVAVIQSATTAGDRAGSYLSAVRGYNIATRKLD